MVYFCVMNRNEYNGRIPDVMVMLFLSVGSVFTAAFIKAN